MIRTLGSVARKKMRHWVIFGQALYYVEHQYILQIMYRVGGGDVFIALGFVISLALQVGVKFRTGVEEGEGEGVGWGREGDGCCFSKLKLSQA